MGASHTIRPFLTGFLAAAVFSAVWANDADSDGEVTKKAAIQAQNLSKNDEELPVDYPSLCRMAELHRDWTAAWGFAEKWAEAKDKAVRADGIRKLMELSFFRSGTDAEKILAMAPEAGLSERELQTYQARLALKRRDYLQALQLLEKIASGSGLAREELSRILHLQILARLGLKEYAAAAELAARRRSVTGDDESRFQAACYQIYALALDGKAEDARNLWDQLAAGNPAHAGELADLRIFLTARQEKWTDFAELLKARGGQTAGSCWYLAACRTAAEYAEKSGDWEQAVKMRRAVLQAAAEDDDRKQAVLQLLAALDSTRAWKDMADVLKMYLAWYPDTVDRQKLQCQAARYLVKAGDLRGALKLYDAVLGSENISAADRFAAAMEAAEQCGAGDLTEDELKYLESAVRHAPASEKRQEACFRLGMYYERAGVYKRAQEAFQTAAQEKGPLQEKAQLFRLQSMIKSRDFAEALKIAAGLCKAQATDVRAAAHYHRASLYEKTGNPDRAAAEYQAFARNFPESEFAAPALYNAALIAENSSDAAETIRRWQAFLQFAPKHELSPNALYKLMMSQELSGRIEESANTAERLVRDFAGSLFAAAALFHMTDRAAAENRYGAALEYLTRVEALPHRNPGIFARVLFDRASIHAKLDNPRKALELLDKLLAAHAADPVAADAAELAGFLSAQLGEYVPGAVFYARAAQLRPGGVFASGCLERHADCLFSAAVGGNAGEMLAKAEKEYRSLLEKGRAYAPLLFKIGRCREAAGDREGAIRIYTEVLYRQAADRQQGVHPDPVWAPKSLYAAIRLNRAKRSLEGARNILRLISLARQIGLETEGDLETIERELQTKYKL